MLIEKFCATLLTNTSRFEMFNCWPKGSEKNMVATSLTLTDKTAPK